MREKRYPFSARWHAHSIELYQNVLYLEDLHTTQRWADVQDLLASIRWSDNGRGVAWLTGAEMELANEIVLWADSYRLARSRMTAEERHKADLDRLYRTPEEQERVRKDFEASLIHY